MTTLERQFLECQNFILEIFSAHLRRHCARNCIRFNVALDPAKRDTLQIVPGHLNGAAYTNHNDIDASNNDDLVSPEDLSKLGRDPITANDVSVFTTVISDAEPSHGVNFDVYYPNSSSASNKIASLPSLGPLFASWQAPNLQNAKHNATNGNVPIGQGYRVVCSARQLDPFQSNEEMWRKVRVYILT